MWRFWLLSSALVAQGTYMAPPAHELGIGPVIHSYGWGAGIISRHWHNERSARVWLIDLTSYRLREETRTRSAYRDQGGKDYVFGKLFYAYLLEGVYGYQRVLLYRSAVSAGQMSLSVGGGPAFAFLKPYYIEIAVPISPTQAIIKVDTYDPQRYTYLDIVGEADFYLGFDRLRVIPGLVVQTALEVNFGREPSLLRAVVVGARLQAFSEGVQTLSGKAPRRIWASGILALYIGNAWN